jgi:hypothetical protein
LPNWPKPFRRRICWDSGNQNPWFDMHTNAD